MSASDSAGPGLALSASTIGLVGRGLRLERGGRTLFEDFDVSVVAGERLAVLGASGSGKTSLLAVLGGLVRPSSGEVTLDGRAMDATVRRRCSHVLQGYGLVTLLTATENVEAALRAAGVTHHDAAVRAAEAIESIGLGEFGDHLVEELSGGQQQRVAVARALALRPDVLLADEPTSEQDSGFRAIVLDRICELSERGAIVLIATHDPGVAERCTRSLRIAPAGTVSTTGWPG